MSNNKKLKTEEPIIVKECFTCGDNDHQRITSLLCRFNPKSPKFVITKPKSTPKFLEIKPKSPSVNKKNIIKLIITNQDL